MSIRVYKSMVEAVEGLRQRGFTTEFTVAKEGGQLTAGDRSFKSNDLTIVEHHRFEGMSDPDDSSVVYALEASSGLKGMLVDAYGAYANWKTGALLKHTKDSKKSRRVLCEGVHISVRWHSNDGWVHLNLVSTEPRPAQPVPFSYPATNVGI